MVRRVTWFGDRAVLVPVVSPTERESVATSLTVKLPDTSIRRGIACVLVESPAPRADLLKVVRVSLENIASAEPDLDPPRLLEIEVHYTGVDLFEAAAVFGVTTAGLIAAHTAQKWRVAMMGFAPGFGYLEPVGQKILPWTELVRRDNPRTRVPAGSVAVAAGMSAVYPSSSPGGWHLLGNTTTTLFDSSNDMSPALLRPGAQVRFIDVTNA